MQNGYAAVVAKTAAGITPQVTPVRPGETSDAA